MKKYTYRIGGLSYYVTANSVDEAKAKIKAINPDESFDIISVAKFTPIGGDFDDMGEVGKR